MSSPEQLTTLSSLQNQIGTAMVQGLEDHNVAWDMSRLHVEHRDPDHYGWTLLYRQDNGQVAGVFTNDRIQTLATEYVQAASEVAGDQVKRVRFHLDSSLKFNVELWYTPPEGRPGWSWADETL